MGCDIHLHIEVRLSSRPGKWEHYSTPRVDRNYDMFALMADCRNDKGKPVISNPKGLPDDLSTITRWAFDEECKRFSPHHVSWLDQQELELLEKWNRERRLADWPPFGYLLDNGFDQDLSKIGLDDVRFVFWFDN